MSIAPQLCAQQLLGGITGTVSDASGAAVPEVEVAVKNLGTNLEIKTSTQVNGGYQVSSLPIGDYSVTFTREGFKTETHTAISVAANRTTTVDGKLQVGVIATSVEVTATPMLNQTDATVGYVLDTKTIEDTPLGTGSFTQLAILSPGVNADMLNGSGTNAGLGNQAIWANGQRDTSNSFSINGVTANNIFNGKSSSEVASSRYTTNTGVTSLGDGDTRTNTSVYDAIGQAMPTPPQETIDELRVNASQYDATQSPNSGAHVEVITKAGSNSFHGQVYEYFQNSDLNAATFFRNKDTTIPASQKVLPMHYNRYGGTLGGRIIRDKLFFFGAYQGIRNHDSLASVSKVTVPTQLTDDRSSTGLSTAFGIPATSLSPVSLEMMQFKLPNGQYLVPSPTITDNSVAKTLGYNALIQGSPTVFTENLGIADIDYNISNLNRLSFRYMLQNSPTTAPFGLSQLDGFPEVLQAGGEVAALDDAWTLKPNLTLDLHAGFIREKAFATMGQPDGLTPADLGINLFGITTFPGLYLYRPNSAVSTNNLIIGPNSNFANAGIYQNRFQGGTTVNWAAGRHLIVAGFDLDHTQLNVINRNNQVADMEFDSSTTFNDFLKGTNLYAPYTYYFDGSSNRYYRANQLGLFVQDKVRLSPTLNLSAGLRWDWDGPLAEKYGLLANFHPDQYQYNAATDTVTNSGVVIAGNNPIMGTSGVSDSTLTARQWGFGPRLGLAWSPGFAKNLVVRAGVGIYYDRGEFFSEFSPGAGRGFSGPFGVTLQLPFTSQISSTSTSTLAQPFGAAPQPAPTNANAITQLLPNVASMSKGSATYLFSSYDPANTLPYTKNWSLDMQWQPANSVVATLGYVGNRGRHLLMPIDFNQPQIATPQSPINGQSYSYGFNVIPTENLKTYDGGNTDLRVPYLGFSTNAMMWEAEGISTYNALQAGLQKHFSHGLQVTAAYTWSHALDEHSGLGLFYNGNNPMDPRQSYGTATFDRTHVFIASYLYQLPKLIPGESLTGKFLNGWAISGVTVLQSGQPYNPYDYSGAVAGEYYANTISVLDPVIGLVPSSTVKQATLQGTTGIDPSLPSIDGSKIYIPTIAPGQMGVPPCTTNSSGAQVCDTFETGFSNGARNVFRGPFQARFDFAVLKDTKLNERCTLKFSGQFYNIFNHPVFDVPNVSLSQYSVSSGVPTLHAIPSSFGLTTSTLGSPRFIQFNMNLNF
jgi:hypothetical protein